MMDDLLTLLASIPEDEIPNPSSLPDGSRMGLRANPLFVGRDEELRELVRALKSGKTVVGVVGLGGMGKTQLVSEFALRYGHHFAGGVFWLSFTVAENVPSEIAACGGMEALDLHPNFSQLTQNEQVGLVRRAWSNRLPRLLIFDSCMDENVLVARLPPAGSGSCVLLTSRQTRWSRHISIEVIRLSKLQRSASVSLLGKFRSDLEGNEVLDAIAAELGDLPLALHLAGSYLEHYQNSGDLGNPVSYLEDLKSLDIIRHRSMQGWLNKASPTAHEQNIARTFALSTDMLAASKVFVDHLALALLARAACFAPGKQIRRSLLVATLECPETKECKQDNFYALERLLELGLIEHGEEEANRGQDGTILLHPLLARFAQERNLAPLLAPIECTLNSIAIEFNRLGNFTDLFLLLPHVLYLTGETYTLKEEQSARFYHTLGDIYKAQVNYSTAQDYYERALKCYKNLGLADHPDTAQNLNDLGNLLRRQMRQQRDFETARKFLQQALAIREKVLGSTHPDTAQTLYELGEVYYAWKNNYPTAHKYFQRAIRIWAQHLAPDDPTIRLVQARLDEVSAELGDP